MAERRLEVIESRPDGVVLRALGACTECSGCGGRCDVFRDAAGLSTPVLPRSMFAGDPMPGQQWMMTLDDRELLRQSLHSHGAALLGLVLGAAAGYLGAALTGSAQDPATLVAAIAGTLMALRLSKRTDLLPRVRIRALS